METFDQCLYGWRRKRSEAVGIRVAEGINEILERMEILAIRHSTCDDLNVARVGY
jgi:hypothetical protein